jgi:hypothetical protein
MTLNVLRDNDGNMMSLIKYWNPISKEEDPSPEEPSPEEPDYVQAILDELILDLAQLG